ncbi:MAG: phosphate signaling complex protein PhoU [Steroidobacteraceae bacterium]
MTLEQADLGHHYNSRYNEELERLRAGVLQMGGLVEQQLRSALLALASGSAADAERVLRGEYRVNAMEVGLDEECNRILATRGPTASDLRLVVAVLKAITDLERVGDEARKIGTIGLRQGDHDRIPGGHRVVRNLGTVALDLLQAALEVFARLDADAALAIARRDRVVDAEHESVQRQCITFMMEDPRSIRAAIDMLWVARALERVGDHAKNICEHVVYLVQGRDIRHAAPDEPAPGVAGSATGEPRQPHPGR